MRCSTEPAEYYIADPKPLKAYLLAAEVQGCHCLGTFFGDMIKTSTATERSRNRDPKMPPFYDNRSLSIPLALMDVVKRLEGIYTDG